MAIQTTGLSLLILSLFFSLLQPVEAAVPQTYTNGNLWSSTHDVPTSFSIQPDGSIVGTTQTGKTFRQSNVVNDHGVRLQKFTIDEAWFYVTGHETFSTSTDALAVQHALRLEYARYASAR